VLTLVVMQRSRNNAVTEVPVLIPCQTKEREGLATFLGESGEKFQPVRAFTEGDLVPKSHKHPLRTMLDIDKMLFTQVLALLRGLEKKDHLAVARARERLIEVIARKENVEVDPWVLEIVNSSNPDRKPDENKKIALELATLGPRSSADLKWLLSTQVSEELSSVRLVLWWSGKQFRPALYCPDPKSALYTFVLMKTAAGRGWGVCPFCGIFFVQTRSDQNYCTVAHREAHRVARWRDSKKSQSKKKGEKNVTKKTR
jgi:hypothetical protein